MFLQSNSKWLKDLNIRYDTIELLEENIGKTFSDINYTNVFLGQSPEAREINTRDIVYNMITIVAAAAAKSLQSCPTLCDPIDGGPPGSPVPGILQARTLEWVAISFFNA